MHLQRKARRETMRAVSFGRCRGRQSGRQSGRRRHRGAVYLAVLMTSLIVASLALAAVSAAHYYARDLNDEGDFRQAQLAADAALEWAVADINATSNWRSVRTNNVDTLPLQLGNASIRYRLIDLDGLLADDPLDACEVLVTASVGAATCAWRAALEPAGAPLRCLGYALAAKDDIEPEAFAMWCSDGLVGVGKSVTVNSAGSLTADCHYGDSVSGIVYGTLTTLGGNLETPTTSLLDHYAQKGVAINAAQLPLSGSTLVIDKQLLSSNTNSISSTVSPSGIYVIDCENKTIDISNSRLVCTLVLRNVGGNSKVSQSVYWEAAQANYPALLVDGDFDFALTKQSLKESTVGINFNPVGTAFRGVEDSSLTTVYPSQLRGLIFVSGRIDLSNALAENDIYGVLVGGEKARGAGDLFLNYRNIYSLNPPPGFRKFDQVRLAAGSARRVAAP